MLFGKFRILGKLTLLVIVPLLGVVALSIPIIVSRVADAKSAQDTSNVVQVATQVSTAVQEIQEERLLSIGFLFGLVQEPELVVQSAKATDAVARVGDGGKPVSDSLRRALRGASKLDNTRQNVLNRAIRPDTLVTEFTNVITPIINGLGLSANADLTTGVGRQVYALEQALRTDDMISQAAGYLAVATITKNAGFVSLFYSTLVQLQQVILNAQSFFTDAQYKLYLGAQDAFSSRVGSAFLTLATVDPATAIQQLNVKTLFPSLRSVLVLGGFVEKRVAADVDNDRDEQPERRAPGRLPDRWRLARAADRGDRPEHLHGPRGGPAAAPPDRLGRPDRPRRRGRAGTRRRRRRRVGPPDPPGSGRRRGPGRDRRPGPRVRPGADHRRPAGGAPGARPPQRRPDVRPRRPPHAEPGRPPAGADRQPGAQGDRQRPPAASCTGSTTCPAVCGGTRPSLVVLSGGAGANEHMAPLSLTDVVRLALGRDRGLHPGRRGRPRRHRGGAGRPGRPDAAARRADGERHVVLPAAHPGHGLGRPSCAAAPASRSSTTAWA